MRIALSRAGLTQAYRNRPPYQRNDYVGWITRARLAVTQRRRLKQMLDELRQGDVYMNMPWKPRAR